MENINAEKTKSENNEVEKTLDLLDKNYFHVCKKINEEGNLTSWTVYYENMNDEDYLSEYNKPILNSKFDTIDDIINVKEQFDKSKIKAGNNIIWEKFELGTSTFNYISKITDKFSIITIILEIVFLIFLVAFESLIKSIAVYFIMLIAFSIVILCLDYLQDEIRKGAYEILENNEKLLLKNELKYRKDNVYEFRKKNRTNSFKKIQSARH